MRMMVADVRTSPTLHLGTPRPLFEFQNDVAFNCLPASCYSVAPDDQRLYTIQLPLDTPTPPATIRLELNP
jgi:hypothetical protein